MKSVPSPNVLAVFDFEDANDPVDLFLFFRGIEMEASDAPASQTSIKGVALRVEEPLAHNATQTIKNRPRSCTTVKMSACHVNHSTGQLPQHSNGREVSTTTICQGS